MRCVCVQGGKQIGGPQASGVLCGRRDLVSAAALQHLDLDIYWEQWSPPPALIDKLKLVGAPHHGIGRVAKVGRETIVGLMVALKLFVEEDPHVRWGVWLRRMEELAASLRGLGLDEPADSGCRVELLPGSAAAPSSPPAVMLHLNEAKCGLRAMDVVKALQDDYHIAPKPPLISKNAVGFGPLCLREGEPEIVAQAVRTIVSNAASENQLRNDELPEMVSVHSSSSGGA
jgi:D-glucosaminate-6-phosphate ammonia-lyase